MNEIINQCCKIWDVKPEHFVFARTRKKTAQKQILIMLLAQHRYEYKAIGIALYFAHPENAGRSAKQGVTMLQVKDKMFLKYYNPVAHLFPENPLTHNYNKKQTRYKYGTNKLHTATV